jgi:hypothetical protein
MGEIWGSQSSDWKLLSSGMWQHIVWYIFTDVSGFVLALLLAFPFLQHWPFFPTELFCTGDGGSRFVHNVGKYVPNYTASHPRWLWSSYSLADGTNFNHNWSLFTDLDCATWYEHLVDNLHSLYEPYTMSRVLVTCTTTQHSSFHLQHVKWDVLTSRPWKGLQTDNCSEVKICLHKNWQTFNKTHPPFQDGSIKSHTYTLYVLLI